MISTVLDELTEQLPAGVVVVDPEILDSYRRDRADLVAAGTPGALMRPTSTAEVATSMRWASHHGVTVVARGAGSGLSGGANAIDGCLMISLDRSDAPPTARTHHAPCDLRGHLSNARLRRCGTRRDHRQRSEPQCAGVHGSRDD